MHSLYALQRQYCAVAKTLCKYIMQYVIVTISTLLFASFGLFQMKLQLFQKQSDRIVLLVLSTALQHIFYRQRCRNNIKHIRLAKKSISILSRNSSLRIVFIMAISGHLMRQYIKMITSRLRCTRSHFPLSPGCACGFRYELTFIYHHTPMKILQNSAAFRGWSFRSIIEEA